MSVISQDQKEKLGQDFKQREMNVGTVYIQGQSVLE